MGDAQVKGPAKDRALGRQGPVIAKVLPQAQRDFGQFDPAAPAAAVRHGLIPVGGSEIRHGVEYSPRRGPGGRGAPGRPAAQPGWQDVSVAWAPQRDAVTQRRGQLMYDAMMAETVSRARDGGDQIEAYLARPMEPGSAGSVVVIHHTPGYESDMTKEITRTFASTATTPSARTCTAREAPGASPDDAAAAARAAGGGGARRAAGRRRRRRREVPEGRCRPRTARSG